MTDASPAARGDGVSATRAALHLAAIVDGEVQEWRDDDAMKALGDGLLGTCRERPGSSLWIDLSSPDEHLVERVAELIGLHPLVAEDIVEGNQRPKAEVTDGLVHIVLFALEYQQHVVAHELDLVLGEGFLLSAHPAGWDPRSGNSFRTGVAAVMKAGPDHVLWAICDTVVDAYFPFADRMEDEIDRLQDQVVERTDRTTLNRIFTLKRELIDVRRAITPFREVLNQLTNRDLGLVDAEEIVYFRDVYDHVIRLTDELDNDRELVAATLDVYLSTINNNLSLIMKRLTGVTVILAGIGAIAGIFGMSEAGSAFAGGEAAGFWLVALATVIISAAAAFALRKLGWI